MRWVSAVLRTSPAPSTSIPTGGCRWPTRSAGRYCWTTCPATRCWWNASRRSWTPPAAGRTAGRSSSTAPGAAPGTAARTTTVVRPRVPHRRSAATATDGRCSDVGAVERGDDLIRHVVEQGVGLDRYAGDGGEERRQPGEREVVPRGPGERVAALLAAQQRPAAVLPGVENLLGGGHSETVPDRGRVPELDQGPTGEGVSELASGGQVGPLLVAEPGHHRARVVAAHGAGDQCVGDVAVLPVEIGTPAVSRLVRHT